MDSSTRTTAPARQLRFGFDVPCPSCRGKGKLRSRWDAKLGRWYAPKCSLCRGGGVVTEQPA